MTPYSFEDALQILHEHADKYDEQHKKQLASFAENNPGEWIPDHLVNAFNLPKALIYICEEIQKLKDQSNVR